MNEIVKLVMSKTGLSEKMAKMAVDVVISQLKSKLPPAIGSQVDSFLGTSKSSKSSANPLGGLADKLGGLGGLLGKK